MRTYVSQVSGGLVQSVAFSQAENGKRYGFIHARPDASTGDQVRRLLTQSSPPATIRSTTRNATETLIVVTGFSSDAAVLTPLESEGQRFAQPSAQKAFNPWAWRGVTSIIGQSGQLLSSYFVYDHAKRFEMDISKLARAKADSIAIAGFAVLNLCANVINIMFGAQEKNDPNHFAFLTSEFDARFANAYGHQLASAPSSGPAAGAVRTDKPSKFHTFLDRYSVSFGEIFLRTLGSVSLAFPVVQFKAGFEAFKAHGLQAGYQAMKNKNSATFIYGLAMLLGKGTSFMASEPDPYNPAPMGPWRAFREKVAFKLSSVIEGLGAGWSSHDRFKYQKIHVGNKTIADIPGGIGNAVFVAGYGIRYTAPFGTREVDMPTLYQHIGSALARLPDPQQPEAIASNAHWLVDHFSKKKDPKYTLPSIYLALTEAVDRQKKGEEKAPHADAPAQSVEASKPAMQVSQMKAHETIRPARAPALLSAQASL